MPVYDYQCVKCGKIEEKIHTIRQHETESFQCSCGGDMASIITASGQYCGNEDADWLKSVPAVVDKEGGPAAQEFIKNPTRTNYKNWMKEAGVRPMDHGEGPGRPDKPDMTKAMDTVMRKHYERMSDSEYRRRSERILKDRDYRR